MLVRWNCRPLKVVSSCATALLIASLFLVSTLVLQRYGDADYIPITSSLSSQPDEVAELQAKLESVRLCLRNHLATKHPAWSFLHLLINSCSMAQFPSFDFLKFHTDKLYLKFKDPSPATQRCAVVTLGIGNDTLMERDLFNHYPQCRFYGADPTPEVSVDYVKYGKYFQFAVDDVTGEQDLHILDGKGDYRPKKMQTKALNEFLESDVKEPIIHYMSMDIEGSEYRLMPYLVQNHARLWGELSNINNAPPKTQESQSPDSQSPLKSHSSPKQAKNNQEPIICQMTMELHGPLKNYGKDNQQFERLFTEFVSKSSFVPLRAFSPGNHHRFFAFNGFEPRCIELFSFRAAQNGEVGLMAHDKPPTAPQATKFPNPVSQSSPT